MKSIVINIADSFDNENLNRLRIGIYKNIKQQGVPVICSYTIGSGQNDIKDSQIDMTDTFTSQTSGISGQNDNIEKPLDNPQT
jgi:hypothetical protein